MLSILSIIVVYYETKDIFTKMKNDVNQIFIFNKITYKITYKATCFCLKSLCHLFFFPVAGLIVIVVGIVAIVGGCVICSVGLILLIK